VAAGRAGLDYIVIWTKSNFRFRRNPFPATSSGWLPYDPDMGTSNTPTPVERASVVAAAAAADSEQIHRDGRLTDAVLAALVDTNMFRVSAPLDVGGDEVDVASFASVLETIGRADLSTGWCVVQANASARSMGSRFGNEFARELLAGPDSAIAAGFPTGLARADRVDGGYMVNGRWGFASGCLHCNWFDGRAAVHVDGEPVRTATGLGYLASHLVPADQVTIVETWDVAGLRGTGSHTYVIEDVFVPEERSLPLFAEVSGLEAPMRVPQLTFAHVGFASMGLGAAWSALDDFTALLESKTPGLSTTPLRETATAQRTIGEVRAHLRAASTHMEWMTGLLVEAAGRGTPSVDDLAEARLAIVSTVDTSLDAVEKLYRVAGTTGIFTGSPLHRRFQDLHVLSQQVFARPSHYENVGRQILGLDHEAGLI
jgi:alkylation response protein AidB-like acyl-CoA dehydrogenase